MAQYYHTINSPLGKVLLLTNGDVLTGFYFEEQKHFPKLPNDLLHKPTLELFKKTAAQVQHYFESKRNVFDIRYQFYSGTEFQKKVWHALAKIPYGKTLSYGQFAKQIGVPESVRAVAAAIGRNPISVIVPCHRIIGSDGSLTGYAGGLERKQALLELEQCA